MKEKRIGDGKRGRTLPLRVAELFAILHNVPQKVFILRSSQNYDGKQAWGEGEAGRGRERGRHLPYPVGEGGSTYFIIGMEETIGRLEEFASWKETMRKCCRVNKLNIDIVSYYTPLKFRGSYSRFKAIYAKKPVHKPQRWIENELKAFYWTCVAISCVQSLRITEFGSSEWQIIQDIFYFKQPLTLEYEGKKLVDDPNVKQPWSPQEDTLLSEIVQDCCKNCNKWNEFARRLFQASQKRFYRTGKQCRERWLNHLDPSKRHGEWEKEEDMEIVRLLGKEGKKWSLIAKKLGSHRTEHMVKNRFKTILLKQKKEYPNIRNEMILVRSFMEPVVAEKYLRREKLRVEEPMVEELRVEVGEIKLQHKSHEQLFESQQEKNLIQEESEKGQENLPQTSCAFELPQVYSPCIYMNIPITPTFSPSVPFFVNFSSFSAFDANFSSQFYSSKKTSDKFDKPEPEK